MKDDPALIAHAISTRLNELDAPSPYAVATESEISPDTVYGLRKGNGARIDAINNVLVSLDLVIVPRSCTTKRAIELGYIDKKES